jgi:DNA invertase Pin-like site-specific DNA recombinase
LILEGGTLVVPKLDRLARSVPDARAIGADLADLAELFTVSRTTVYRTLQRDATVAKHDNQ